MIISPPGQGIAHEETRWAGQSRRSIPFGGAREGRRRLQPPTRRTCVAGCSARGFPWGPTASSRSGSACPRQGAVERTGTRTLPSSNTVLGQRPEARFQEAERHSRRLGKDEEPIRLLEPPLCEECLARHGCDTGRTRRGLETPYTERTRSESDRARRQNATSVM